MGVVVGVMNVIAAADALAGSVAGVVILETLIGRLVQGQPVKGVVLILLRVQVLRALLYACEIPHFIVGVIINDIGRITQGVVVGYLRYPVLGVILPHAFRPIGIENMGHIANGIILRGKNIPGVVANLEGPVELVVLISQAVFRGFRGENRRKPLFDGLLKGKEVAVVVVVITAFFDDGSPSTLI